MGISEPGNCIPRSEQGPKWPAQRGAAERRVSRRIQFAVKRPVLELEPMTISQTRELHSAPSKGDHGPAQRCAAKRRVSRRIQFAVKRPVLVVGLRVVAKREGAGRRFAGYSGWPSVTRTGAPRSTPSPSAALCSARATSRTSNELMSAR